MSERDGGADSLVRSDALFDALISFAEGLAWCPCCEGVLTCARGCTIREDSQCADGRNRYDNMLAARRALKTKPHKPNSGVRGGEAAPYPARGVDPGGAE